MEQSTMEGDVMPVKPSVHEQEMSELAWFRAVLSVTDVALRTVDVPDELLVLLAEQAADEAEGEGQLIAHAYRLALIKLLWVAIEDLHRVDVGVYGERIQVRDLVAQAQNLTAEVRVVVETALAAWSLGLPEVLKALSYPEGVTPRAGAIARAAILALKVRLEPMDGIPAQWAAVAEIAAKVGR